MSRLKFDHWTTLLTIGLLSLASARAQQPQPPPAPLPLEHPANEPSAFELSRATGQRLASAQSMNFTAITTYEAPARNSQPPYDATVSKVAMQRPNKVRVITSGDSPASNFYYDRKTMMAYAPFADQAAVADAPGTTAAAYDRATIHSPFETATVADPYKTLSDGLTSAFVAGPSPTAGDTVTELPATANATVQAGLWIGIPDGLPPTIRPVYPKDPAQSRFEIQFSNWHLNPAMETADFATAQAMKPPPMKFARPDAPLPGQR